MKGNRLIIGLLVLSIFIATVLLRQFNPLIVDMIFLIIITISGIEMSRAVANKYAPPLVGIIATYPIFSIAAYIGGSYLEKLVWPFLNGLTMVLLLLVVYIIVTIIITSTSKKYTKSHFLSTVFVLIYPMTLAVCFYAVNHFGQISTGFEPMIKEAFYGATPLAILYAVTAMSDTMAFCVGKLCKGPKLCPKISPKKTISGAIGGLFGGVIGAAGMMGLSLANWMGIMELEFITGRGAGTFILHAFLIGVIGSVCTQVGDLIASIVKRDVGIKDYGHLLGDHGGVMDRIDGQLFSAFFIFVYLTIASVCA